MTLGPVQQGSPITYKYCPLHLSLYNAYGYIIILSQYTIKLTFFFYEVPDFSALLRLQSGDGDDAARKNFTAISLIRLTVRGAKPVIRRF